MKRRWFDPVNWFDFQNIRDGTASIIDGIAIAHYRAAERVEAFKDLLWEGVYTYSYYGTQRNYRCAFVMLHSSRNHCRRIRGTARQGRGDVQVRCFD